MTIVMQSIEPGLKGTAQVIVSPSNTAAALGNLGVDVFATPYMVALMEQACRAAVDPLLPPGIVTVGGLVELRHTAPSPEGMTVTASARLVEVKGAKLVFDVEIRDDFEKAGEGRHVRFTAAASELEARAARKAAAMRERQEAEKGGTK